MSLACCTLLPCSPIWLPSFFLLFFFLSYGHHRDLHSFPTRRSSDLCGRSRSRGRSARSRFPRPPSTSRPARRDRKSTRLNSSHLGISYAVFCLKNKNSRALEHRLRRAGRGGERRRLRRDSNRQRHTI